MNSYAIDIETNGLLRPEPGRDRIMDRVHCAVAVPLSGGPHLRFHDCPLIPREGNLHDFLTLINGAEMVVGHGAIDFDIPALRVVYGKEAVNPREVRDTLVIARVLVPWVRETDFRRRDYPTNLIGSHSLEAWARRIGLRKGEFHKHADSDPDLWNRFTLGMLDYCAMDTAITAELYDRLMQGDVPTQALDRALDRALELEHAFAGEIGRMMGRGVAFDMEGALRLTGVLQVRRAETMEKLEGILGTYTKRWVTKVKRLERSKEIQVNPGSRMQVTAALQRLYGWKPKLFTKDGIPQFDEAVIRGIPDATIPGDVKELLLENFLLQKRLGQLAEGARAWTKMVVPGGQGGHRIHGYVNHSGAHTSRCTHRNPNVAQVPRVSSPYGRECRALFRASPGMEIVGADMSGIEIRMIAHYLTPYDGGKLVGRITSGEDVHEGNQRAAKLPTRQDAKNTLYAVCYGALPKKVAEMNGVPLRRGTEIRGGILAGIPGLDRLISEVQTVVEDRGFLFGLDGRKLRPRKTFSALNTLIQGAGAIVMKRATVLASQFLGETRYTAHLILHVHDEYQWECPPGEGKDVGPILVRAIEEAGRDLNVGCPLTGEWKVGPTWADTH